MDVPAQVVCNAMVAGNVTIVIMQQRMTGQDDRPSVKTAVQYVVSRRRCQKFVKVGYSLRYSISSARMTGADEMLHDWPADVQAGRVCSGQSAVRDPGAILVGLKRWV